MIRGDKQSFDFISSKFLKVKPLTIGCVLNQPFKENLDHIHPAVRAKFHDPYVFLIPKMREQKVVMPTQQP
jgi:hypothetical protein